MGVNSAVPSVQETAARTFRGLPQRRFQTIHSLQTPRKENGSHPPANSRPVPQPAPKAAAAPKRAPLAKRPMAALQNGSQDTKQVASLAQSDPRAESPPESAHKIRRRPSPLVRA